MSLGYPTSAAFYLLSFTDWFARFLWPSIALPRALSFWLPSAVVLGLLVVVNLAGVEETGTSQVVVTALKMTLVGLFPFGGLRAFQPEVFADSLVTSATHFGDAMLLG